MYKKAIRLVCLMMLALSLCACRGQKAQDDAYLAVTQATETTEATKAANPTEATTGATEPATTEAIETTEATISAAEDPRPAKTKQDSSEAKPNTVEQKPEEEEESTKPTQPKQEESSKPSEPKQEQDEMPDWKMAYLDFLQTKQDEYISFALVYVDNDDIPELYMSGCCEAAGDSICAYKNGVVVEEYLARTDGGSYIPRSGLLMNANGSQGYYTTEVYKLTSKGFSRLWVGDECADYVELENGDYEEVFQYSIGDKVVSEEEFYAAIEAVYNTSKAVSFSRNAVSYDAIRKQITNY